jgi:glycosyltransferase involved in cell wall biosynthesis
MKYNNQTSLDLSIIVPAFNEEESIRILYEEIVATLEPENISFEVIFVDDGSSDSTFEEIQRLQPLDNYVIGIQFRRNFGKSIALSTGFQLARGQVIVTMDADLQDDPSEIPRLLEKISEGYDVVSGWKRYRLDPLEKRLASKVFNKVVSAVSGLKLKDFNCGLKAYHWKVAKEIRIYGQQHRFIPVIASSKGFRVCEIPVKHHERRFGRSKFGLGRYLHGMLDLLTVKFLTDYGQRPLHFLGTAGMCLFVPGCLLISFVMVMKFGLGQTGNRPSLIAGVFLLGMSFQVFFVGLLAELVTFSTFSANLSPDQFQRQRWSAGPGRNTRQYSGE